MINPADITFTVNANGVAGTDRSGATFDHDGGSLDNRVTFLIAKIRDNSAQRLISTATMGGVSMTKIADASRSYNYSGNNWESIDVYVLANSPSGTQSIVVTYNGTVNLSDAITVITVPGANLTTPTGADETAVDAGTTTNLPISITSTVAGSLIIAAWCKTYQTHTAWTPGGDIDGEITDGVTGTTSAAGDLAYTDTYIEATTVTTYNATSTSDTSGRMVGVAFEVLPAPIITELEATINVASTISAETGISRGVASTVSPATSISADLTQELTLAAVSNGVTSNSAALDIAGLVDLASSITAVSSISADQTVELVIAGQSNGQSSNSGVLSKAHALAASINATSSIGGSSLSVCAEPPALLFIINGQSNAGAQGDWAELDSGWQTLGNELQLYFPQGGLGSNYNDLPSSGSQSANGFGIELGAYEVLKTAFPGRKLLFAKASLGGASITNWCNSSCNGAEYEDLVELTNLAISKALALSDVDDVKVAALFWAQVEADTPSTGTATAYAGRLEELISSYRDDVGDAELPVIVMRPHTHGGSDGFPIIDAGIQGVAAADDFVVAIATDDLPEWPDSTAHFDTAGTLEFGQRYAEAFLTVYEEDDCVDLGAGIHMGANIIVSSSISADVSLTVQTAGESGGQSSVVASFVKDVPLNGEVDGASSITATLTTLAIVLESDIDVQSSVVAALVAERGLEVEVQTAGESEGGLSLTLSLVAEVNVVSGTEANLFSSLPFFASASALSSVSAQLRPTPLSAFYGTVRGTRRTGSVRSAGDIN